MPLLLPNSFIIQPVMKLDFGLIPIFMDKESDSKKVNELLILQSWKAMRVRSFIFLLYAFKWSPVLCNKQ